MSAYVLFYLLNKLEKRETYVTCRAFYLYLQRVKKII